MYIYEYIDIQYAFKLSILKFSMGYVNVIIDSNRLREKKRVCVKHFLFAKESDDYH